MARQARVSYIAFSMILDELLSGATTTQALADASGLTRRYCAKLMAVLHGRKVVHIASWEADSLGRMSIAAYALGHGKDAARKPKTKLEINRDWRRRAAGKSLVGTPFHGLGVVSANDAGRARA